MERYPYLIFISNSAWEPISIFILIWGKVALAVTTAAH